MSGRLEDPPISVRLVSADYYICSPRVGLDIGYSTYRGSEIKRVPVIRVFGSTSKGHKVCLHIHGIFPYFLIPYDGSGPSDAMGRQIALGLDKAINIFQGQGTSGSHHIFKIALVSGIPVYGYHEKEHQFLKVYFYNPIVRKHSYDLLLNGAVLNKMLQPSEAHIPYVLQFLIDFNIQGMNYIHLKSAFCRRKPDGYEDLNDVNVEPSSTCELEIDCLAEDILNILDVQGGIKMNPGLAALWEEERERRRIKGMDVESVNIPDSQARQSAKPTSSDVHFRGLIKQRLKDYSRDIGDVSLSFCEVNETLETSLAIETPDEQAGELLSASYVDFHRPRSQNDVTLTSFSEEGDMLDILCELADEQSFTQDSGSRPDTPNDSNAGSQQSKTSVLSNRTPLLEWTSPSDTIEDSPYDDDSILGSQCSKGINVSKEYPASLAAVMSDSSDDEKETFEMSQVFDSGHDLFDQEEACTENTRDSRWSQNLELPELPNVDGPIEDDSSTATDETKTTDEADLSKSSKKRRSYKPLALKKEPRSSLVSTRTEDSKTMVAVNSTAFNTSGSSFSSYALDRSDATCRGHPRALHSSMDGTSFADSLYIMSFPSPPLQEPRSSPPRPSTPVRQPQVILSPLIKEISKHEKTSGKKLSLRSPRVVLNRAREEAIIKNALDKDGGLASSFTRIQSQEAMVRSRLKRQSPCSNRITRGKKKLSKSFAATDTNNPPDVECTFIAEQPTDLLLSSEKVIVDRIVIVDDVTNCPLIQTGVDKSIQSHKDDKDAPKSEHALIANIIVDTVESSVVIEKSIINDKNVTVEIEAESDESTLVDIDTICEELEATTDTVTGGDTIKSTLTNVHNTIPDYSSLNLPFETSETSTLIGSQESTPRSSVNEVEEDRKQTNIISFKGSTVYVPSTNPPSYSDVLITMDAHGIFPVDNGTAFWGDASDASAIGKEARAKDACVATKLVSSLPVFSKILRQVDVPCGDNTMVRITPVIGPPSRLSVCQWLEETKRKKAEGEKLSLELKKSSQMHDRSQIEQATMNNSFGFKVSFGNCHEAKAVHQYQYLTILSLELHITTRQDLRPDPEFDAIEAIFFTLTNDVPEDSSKSRALSGVIAVDYAVNKVEQNSTFFKHTAITDVPTTSVANELLLFSELIQLVKTWDPDILVGYEIEMLSWGYLLQRASFLGIPLHNCLSRVPTANAERGLPNQDDIVEGGYIVEKNSDIAVVGRIVLNLWRILRPEVAAQSYTFENMVYHILHRRVPLYSFSKLTAWWNDNIYRWLVVEHYATRAKGNLELMEQLDLIGRTSELARLFGIQFYEVFTRGSQFRVESMMLRLTKPNNFIALSPSVTQRSRMKAPEWLPLILEPESRFYTDPVLVLDFQSLYPSMIIAYNYCYSTCLGRSHLLGKNEPFEFGCTHILVPPATVKKAVYSDMVNVSPAGIAFVKPEIRRGILPQMLSEILNTRLMVKSSMKEYKNDTTLRRVFDSRQLGLKLIANVTYGYTSANFSGRMPCVELGDSIVSKGRETLERAIHLIESRSDWKARVVYGDTDSVFVLLPGRGKEEAFKIGAEIADAVTQMNPKPVKLKFEKVYQPCILQTKKRYVGFKYESLDQTEPVYEAKGIETVRRDGCPAVVKILERTLRVLFSTHDLSQVKTYVKRQFTKILQNRASVQDFIFAKEFRGRQGYKPGACVPALEIAKQKLKVDRRSEPRIGERVPYVVVYGMPGVPLIRLIVPADLFVFDGSLKLNAHYYITRAIVPPLQRCFGLLGIDVVSWYTSLPRLLPTNSITTVVGDASRKTTISQYFESSSCLLCDEPAGTNGICSTCASNKQNSALMLSSIQRLREKDYSDIVKLCMFCSGNRGVEQECTSMDCPVFYRRMKTSRSFLVAEKLRDVLSTF